MKCHDVERNGKCQCESSAGRVLGFSYDDKRRVPLEQKFKQTERNSGGNSFRLARKIISIKYERRINSGYPPVSGCWLWSHNEHIKLNWEVIPPKQAETSQKKNSICLNCCYNGTEIPSNNL